MSFELGQVVQTIGVVSKEQEDAGFAKFVQDSFEKYINEDWGDTCKEDAQLNDNAVKNGDDRILALYGKDTDNEIFIITEWDRSATTILFPSEY